MNLTITHTSGENLIHTLLWEIAEQNLNEGKINEQGSSLKGLVAITFASIAFEAYINFVGERLDENIWKKERIFFLPE